MPEFRFGPPVHQDSGFNEPKGGMSDFGVDRADVERPATEALASASSTALLMPGADTTSATLHTATLEDSTKITSACTRTHQPSTNGLLDQCGIPISHQQPTDQDLFAPPPPKSFKGDEM